MKKVIDKKYMKYFLVLFLVIIISILFNKIIYNLTRMEKKYAHFSIDDTIIIFKDLYVNEERYNSIFQNPTLNYLKELHDTYGIVVSCYCWYQDNDFNISMLSDKYKNEFQDNSDWLRFGFHAYDSYAKYTNDSDREKILSEYTKTVNELVRITGGANTIDNVIRLHYYAGSNECVNTIKNLSNGIKGLLTSDDDRNSYYFDANLSAKIYNTDLYIDNELYFFNTDFRIEHMKNVKEELKIANRNKAKSNILIFFTHEWQLNEINIKKYIEEFCIYLINNNYVFDFPEDRI